MVLEEGRDGGWGKVSGWWGECAGLLRRGFGDWFGDLGIFARIILFSVFNEFTVYLTFITTFWEILLTFSSAPIYLLKTLVTYRKHCVRFLFYLHYNLIITSINQRKSYIPVLISIFIF